MVTRLGFRLGIMPKGIAQTASPDETPDPFSFDDVTGVDLSTLTTSPNTVTLAGFTGAIDISISGGDGKYSKNGAAFTAADGTAVVGDEIDLQVTSSGSVDTAVDVIFTAGTLSDTWTVTTAGGGAFDFSDEDNSGLIPTL